MNTSTLVDGAFCEKINDLRSYLSCTLLNRVLARISKMPFKNSNYKISARPDLAIYLLQIVITTSFNNILCQKGQFALQLCARRWLVCKRFGHYLAIIDLQEWVVCGNIMNSIAKILW